MNGWIWLLGLGAIILIVVGWFITYYNRIRILANRIEEAWAQIDVQLQKRFDLVPNLVETVKGYAAHEREIFESIAAARAGMVTGSRGERMQASDALTGALGRLFAVAEAYPDLKAVENFKLFQEQLEGIENKVAYSRQFYNDSVLRFNNTITTIPGTWFASMFGRTKKREFFEATAAERRSVKVEF